MSGFGAPKSGQYGGVAAGCALFARPERDGGVVMWHASTYIYFSTRSVFEGNEGCKKGINRERNEKFCGLGRCRPNAVYPVQHFSGAAQQCREQ